jgi:hypothetical protein
MGIIFTKKLDGMQCAIILKKIKRLRLFLLIDRQRCERGDTVERFSARLPPETG